MSSQMVDETRSIPILVHKSLVCVSVGGMGVLSLPPRAVAETMEGGRSLS
jgi:hypothetical protein